MVTQITPINLIPGTMIPRVNISQYDTGARVLKFQVYNGDSLFTFTNAMSVALVGTKPDGKGFSYTGTIASNMPTFDVTAQMSAVAGKVRAELIVYESGKRCGSGNFVIFVEEGALGENTDMSDSDYAIINDAIEKAFDLDHFYADLQTMVTDAVEDIQVKEGQTVIDPTLSVEGAAADAKATGDMARHFLDALMAETTPTAAIATCDDAAGGLPLKKLTANIEPTQSGTGDPSPDNVRPISGYDSLTVSRTGKNLIVVPNKTETVNGVTATIKDGVVTLSGTATARAVIYVARGISIPAGDYVFSGSQTTLPASCYLNFSSGNGISVSESGAVTNIPFTLATASVGTTNSYVRLDIASGVNTNGMTFKPMIRPAAVTDTEFEPGTIATYAVNFPSEAGTVYGGTLTVNSDGSGTLTVDRAAVDLGTRNWSVVTGNNYSTFSSLTALSDAVYSASTPNILCSIYKPDASNTVSPTGDNYIWLNPGKFIRIKDTAKVGMTADEFKTAMASQTLVYTLATPTTYALSAVQVVQMLAGLNNIWTDAAGTVSGEYYASTALYVQKIVNAQKGMIAGVEEAMTATQNYSVGDLMIVGDALYKATAAISSGAALVIGTNIAQTTVAEQLIALANA